MDQGGGRREADRQTLLAGGQPQAQGNVRLPRAAVADRDHVLPANDALAASELQHQCLVERRDRREVEAVETLHRWEARLLDAALDHPSFPLDQFEFGQAQQVTANPKPRAMCVFRPAAASAGTRAEPKTL